jgi:hypothetical protein
MNVTREQLVKMCKHFGLLQSGKKLELSNRITDYLELVKSIKQPCLVSVDVGIVNLAFAQLKLNQNKIEVLDWQLVEPDVPKTYNVQQYAQKCSQILDRGLFKNDSSLYIIERMSWRSKGFSIPQTILRSTALEALLVGMLLERGNHKVRVESILPGSVSNHFDLVPESVSKNRYQLKKKAAVDKVEWLLDGRIDCPKNLKVMFKNQKKKDDLSDSLLTGIAYLDWIMRAQDYIKSNQLKTTEKVVKI